MKLYLKRDCSEQNVCFIVLDELGEERYYVLKDSSYNFHNLAITGPSLNKLCTIHCVPLPVIYAYNLFDGSDRIRLIFNKNSSRPVISYFGISWRVRGDIFGKNYEIVDTDNTVLLSHYNRWAGCAKGYEVDIVDEPRELLLLASVICIDRIQSAYNKQLQTV